MIVVTKKSIGGTLHKDQIVEVRADAAENPENKLNKNRRLEQARVHAEFQVVQMANVVAFVLEFDVVLFRGFLYLRNVPEGISENIGLGVLYVLLLPVEFERIVTFCQTMKEKFMLPMFRELISGDMTSEGLIRSSMVVNRLPPVEMFSTASV